MMTPQQYRARENRLYVRLLLAVKQPELAAAPSTADSIPCPACGGTLVAVDRDAQIQAEIPACGICRERHYPWRQCPLVTSQALQEPWWHSRQDTTLSTNRPPDRH